MQGHKRINQSILDKIEEQAINKYLRYESIRENRQRISYHPSPYRTLLTRFEHATAKYIRETLMDTFIKFKSI